MHTYIYIYMWVSLSLYRWVLSSTDPIAVRPISVAATDCAAVLQFPQRLRLIPHQAGRSWEVQVLNLIQSCDEITSVDERGLSV